MRIRIAFFSIVLLVLVLNACQDQSTEVTALKSRADGLEKQLAETYKPGFGEFMSGVQAHHAKLWFAGSNQNWKLADFEIHEIKEALEALQKFQSEREETKRLPMVNPALDGVSNAIQKKDLGLFKANYEALTTACNDCHRSVNYEFNLVKTPDSPPFSNQIFSPENAQ